MTTSVLPPAGASSSRATTSLYRFEATLVPRFIGLVPEGIRMANAFEGRCVEGIFEGAHVWGIDHLLLRADGVGVIDAPKTISYGDRHLLEQVNGYCLPPEGIEMPPAEVLLDPGFEWPDLPFPVRAFSTFRSGDPELAHLNRALATVEGSANMATGELVIETRLLQS